jgi:hypothetical protein
MMHTLFYDKIAADLEGTEIADEEAYTGNNFMRQQMMLRRMDKISGFGEEALGIQERVKQRLEHELDNYLSFIANVNYVELIKKYPSKLYDETSFDKEQVVVLKDPIYAASMFDVFAWWRTYGRDNFKYIELCALVVFAKPIHNGFWERMFSGRTVNNNLLRQNMTEETVELSILDAINCNVVDKYMDYYTERKKVDPSRVKACLDNYLRNKNGKGTTISGTDFGLAPAEADDYVIELDDYIDDGSEDEYISEACLQPTLDKK